MAEFYTIILDLTTSTREEALMEVSSTGSGSATFTVYTAGGSSSSASANFNSDNYVCSSSSTITNLFTPSSGATAMVRASSTVGTNAFLRQESGLNNVGYSVPSTTRSLGTLFKFPVGSNVEATKLLVGNPNGSSVTVQIYFGTAALPAVTQVITSNNFAVFTLTQNDKVVRLSASDDVFVQQAVVMASEHDISFIMPM